MIGGLDIWTAIMRSVLRRARSGRLEVELPGEKRMRFDGSETGPSARVAVRDPRMPRLLLAGGSMALAETYMDGMWDTPDLYALLSYGLANEPSGRAAELLGRANGLFDRRDSAPDNDPDGARANIRRHYDLGNEFYELWLDSSMSYSGACFSDPRMATERIPTPTARIEPPQTHELEAAQRRKWDRVLELVQPSRGDRVLEIGCGWGGFAVYAAKQAGCRVTAVTLSEKQAAFARRLVQEEALEGLVEVRLQDYREIPDTYHGIASIEMFEAVGEKWWPAFFSAVKRLLEPGRAAGMQVITIADESFARYSAHEDFIRRHVFPGGMLPSPERFAEAARAAGLGVGEPGFFGHDYSKTLAVWSSTFESVIPRVRELGFDERFIRMWRYYLEYCRVGFDSGNVDVMQVRLEG